MPTPTGSDYVTRARAILATVSGIGTDVTTGVDLTTAPGYEVFLKSGSHMYQGRHNRRIQRVLSIRVYHTLVDGDMSKEAPIRTARTAAETALETYVDTIFDHINLSLNDGGLAITGDAADSLGLMPYNGRVYYGFDIDLDITYQRS